MLTAVLYPILQSTQPAVDPSAGWTPANVAALVTTLVSLLTAFAGAVVAVTALAHSLRTGARADANTRAVTDLRGTADAHDAQLTTLATSNGRVAGIVEQVLPIVVKPEEVK